jgi:hypothetical protein
MRARVREKESETKADEKAMNDGLVCGAKKGQKEIEKFERLRKRSESAKERERERRGGVSWSGSGLGEDDDKGRQGTIVPTIKEKRKERVREETDQSELAYEKQKEWRDSA